MPINISDPNPSDIAQARTLVEQLVLEHYPYIDTRGAIGDLVLGNYALLGAGYAKDADRLLASRSLKALEEFPEAATNEVVDAVLSNFNITRIQPAPATGMVEIVINERLAITITAGSIFTIRGTRYTTTETYTARRSVLNAATLNDIPLVELSGGRYAVRFPVVSEVTGYTDPVRRGDPVVPEIPPQGFLYARAYSAFDSGRDIETNAALIRRLRLGMSIKSWATATTIEALLLSEESGLEPLLGISVIGLGDQELLRTKNPLTGIVASGCDIYVRGLDLPKDTILTKVGEKIGTVGTGALRSLALNADDAPGFYEVVEIRRPGSDEPLQIQQQLLGVDESYPDGPMLDDVLDAAYGPYSTATIQFLDPESQDQSVEFEVVTSTVPEIRKIQDFLNSPERRPLGGDIHVRAAVPCFVSMELVIELEHQGVLVPEEEIRSAVVEVINREAFPGRIYRSQIEAAVTAILQEGSSIRTSFIRGRIRQPNGNARTLTASDVLSVPSDIPNYVSPRTVTFYAHPDDISIQTTLAR